MTPEQALIRAKEIIGGDAVVARALQISIQAVGQWKKAPVHHVLALEDLVKRKVKRFEFRPDVYPPPKRAAAS